MSVDKHIGDSRPDFKLENPPEWKSVGDLAAALVRKVVAK